MLITSDRCIAQTAWCRQRNPMAVTSLCFARAYEHGENLGMLHCTVYMQPESFVSIRGMRRVEEEVHQMEMSPVCLIGRGQLMEIAHLLTNRNDSQYQSYLACSKCE